MKSKAAVRCIVEALKTLYPNALCSLQYQKDYELLFAVRLSAQCTDAVSYTHMTLPTNREV